MHSGPLTLIASTLLSDITQRSSERDLSYNEDLGLKFTLPVKEFLGIQSSFTFGGDFKTYAPSFYLTNYTYFSLYSLDPFGNRILVTNQTIALGAQGHQRVDYFPLSVGWSASRPDRWGTTSFTLNENIFLSGLGSSRGEFQAGAGSAKAGGNYGVTTASLAREQPLGP